MKRREFLTVMAAGPAVPLAATAEAADSSKPEMPNETIRGDMRYRPLGRTGEQVSVIGLGGHHIGRQKEEAESIKIIRAAIDAGINFMDNCWDYHDGGSEIRMGKALRDGYREKVFLMTKIDGRTKKAASEQIDESLRAPADRRTSTCCSTTKSSAWRIPTASSPRAGPWKPCWRRKKAGKIRFIGFTGHKDPLVHSAHAGGRRTARLPLRHRANAAERHGRAFPQL